MSRSYLSFILVLYSVLCLAQKTDAVRGTLLTKITYEHKTADTSQILYCKNTVGDHIAVYTIQGGVISEANAYQFNEGSRGLLLYRQPLMSNQQIKDSLQVAFQDNSHTVVINNTDRYVLFPAYYFCIKKDVYGGHSITTLVDLLADAIGDYPFSDLLYLVNYTPHFDKRIRGATITTQRSQADMTDTWTGKYYYNTHGLLDSVKAYSGKEVRFSKKVKYNGNNTARSHGYYNVESRQIVNRYIAYNIANRLLLKWEEEVYETGKDLETHLSVKLRLKDLGVMHNLNLSTAEVLKIVKKNK